MGRALRSIRDLCCLVGLGALIGCGDGDDSTVRSAPATASASAGGASSATAAGTGAAAGTGGGASGGTSVGPIHASGISTQPDTSAEAECGVAVGQGDIVAAAWITTPMGKYDIRYAFSSDAGVTWSAPALASGDPMLVYDDPTMATGPDGSIYLAFEGYDASENHVYVAKAAPGATSFGPQIEVNDPAASGTPWDKPVVTVTSLGTVIVTFADFDGHLFASRSTDGGRSWQVSTIVADASYRDLAFPCAAEDGGRVWVVYYNDSVPAIGMKYSDDDGATWKPAQEILVSGPSETDVAFDDPTCVGHGGELWVSYDRTTDLNIDTGDFEQVAYTIRLAHSSDGGATFDFRSDAQDHAAASGSMLPYLVREASGALDIAYYAGNTKLDPMGSLRSARSTDGGHTFAPSYPLASPILFSQSRTDSVWLGDYIGFAASGGRLYAAYADNASGASHIDFASVAVP